VIAGAVSAGVLAACLGATWFQEKYWHDDERLFGRDLELFPQNNATAHHALGRALYQRGDDAGAIAHYEEVLRLLPNYARARFNLANCLSRQGRAEEAQAQYRAAIRLRPDNAETYKALGASLATQMKFEEARTNFLTALHYKPDYPEAHTRLGTLLMAQGKADEAISHLAAAVRIYPKDGEAQYYLAHALEDQKKFEEAAFHYRAAIKANPDYDAALNDLAWMWLTEGDPQRKHLAEAITLARRACDFTHDSNVAYLETLGAALSEAGRFSEAIAATERAIAVATSQGSQDVVAKLRKRLAMYRTERSFSGQSLKSKG
jgi:tetratricopeptide (TPR) repeat protein